MIRCLPYRCCGEEREGRALRRGCVKRRGASAQPSGKCYPVFENSMADSKMVLVHHLILASSRHAAQTPTFHAWTLAGPGQRLAEILRIGHVAGKQPHATPLGSLLTGPVPGNHSCPRLPSLGSGAGLPKQLLRAHQACLLAIRRLPYLIGPHRCRPAQPTRPEVRAPPRD